MKTDKNAPVLGNAIYISVNKFSKSLAKNISTNNENYELYTFKLFFLRERSRNIQNNINFLH